MQNLGWTLEGLLGSGAGEKRSTASTGSATRSQRPPRRKKSPRSRTDAVNHVPSVLPSPHFVLALPEFATATGADPASLASRDAATTLVIWDEGRQPGGYRGRNRTVSRIGFHCSNAPVSRSTRTASRACRRVLLRVLRPRARPRPRTRSSGAVRPYYGAVHVRAVARVAARRGADVPGHRRATVAALAVPAAGASKELRATREIRQGALTLRSK